MLAEFNRATGQRDLNAGNSVSDQRSAIGTHDAPTSSGNEWHIYRTKRQHLKSTVESSITGKCGANGSRNYR